MGSAKRALASEKKFDHYYFKADSEGRRTSGYDKRRVPQMRRIVVTGDANDKLAGVLAA